MLLLLFLCVKDRVAVATLHMLVDVTKMGRFFQDRQESGRTIKLDFRNSCDSYHHYHFSGWQFRRGHYMLVGVT